MLKFSYNVTDQSHCRFLCSPNPCFSLRRRIPTSVFRSSPPIVKRRPSLNVKAVVSDQGGPIRVESGTGILADTLRLGSLAEDGFSYKEKFIVRCYEVGINKTATVETIANLLQVISFLFYFHAPPTLFFFKKKKK